MFGKFQALRFRLITTHLSKPFESNFEEFQSMRRNQCPKFDVKTSLQTHYVVSTLIRRLTMSYDVVSKLKRRVSTGINPEYQTNVILFYNYVVKFSKCYHTIINNPHLTFLAKLPQRWYNLFSIEKRNLMLRFQRCINVAIS